MRDPYDARDGAVELHFVDVPVALFLRAQQHTDDVVRELFLMLNDPTPVPPELRQLAALADECARKLAPVRTAVTAQVQAAYDAGVRCADVRATCSASVAAVVDTWDGVLDQLDELSRAGVLLTMPAVDEVRQLRRWHHRQITGQLRDGSAADGWTSWSSGAGRSVSA